MCSLHAHHFVTNGVLKDIYVLCSLDIKNQEVFYQENVEWGRCSVGYVFLYTYSYLIML